MRLQRYSGEEGSLVAARALANRATVVGGALDTTREADLRGRRLEKPVPLRRLVGAVAQLCPPKT